MNHFTKSKLLTALAFAALLLGVTAACNRDPIPIEVLEKELVGIWWDEYEYHDATCGDILISGGTVTAEGECDAAGIGTVTIGGKVGPVSESPFVYKP